LIAAGQSIGNYRIVSKIGTGGMGAVYLAEHPLIGKKVALKVIHRDLANNKEVVQRFFQEAKAVNKIGSDHIVEIHDFGVTPEGDHFYIMEYLDGKTLAALLSRDHVLEIMRALHISAQIASALGAAHNAGVIHRDLKPDNVMLTTRLGDSDFVKLLDFGLAKMLAAGPGVIKTAAGVLLGTPQYMSPEACESRPGVDHRTDIYAVGILLFQMLCGQLPFDGESMGEVLVKQVTQLPPPPRALNPRVPPSVEQIVLRCLMKQPDARFPTMVALREALLDPEKYLAKSPPIAPARSLAPGASPVDAKTVMAYAADQNRTKIGSGTGPVLPLPAPAPTNPGKAGVQTMISDGSLVPPRAPTHGPDMAAPAQPKMNTMRIATPMGYSSRPPRKMWPVVLVFGLLLGLGGGAGWYAWKQGWLVEAQARLEQATRSVIAVVTPFNLADVTVEGREYVERDAILAALGVSAGDSLLGIDLQAARKRLEAIDWVASATVERRLPDTLYVTLKERRAVAIWQNGAEYTLIDKNGRTVRASRMPPGAEKLLLLGGPGAPEHVGELLLLLAYEPSIANQLRAAVWVGQRRWNLVLGNDTEIWLPEEDAVAALQRMAKLEASDKLLSREFGVVDLRLPDKLYLRKRTPSDPPLNGPV